MQRQLLKAFCVLDILSYTAFSLEPRNGWIQGKIFKLEVSRCLEIAILELFFYIEFTLGAVQVIQTVR